MIGFGQDFMQIQNTSFSNFSYSSIAFSDIDNDGDEDVLISGYTNGSVSELYQNDGLGNFSLVIGTPFPNIWGSYVAFSDIDGDGDEDLLITGNDNNQYSLAELYTNDGLGNFTIVPNTSFIGVYASSIGFSDIDNDGDEDAIITGSTDVGGFVGNTSLYSNISSVSSIDNFILSTNKQLLKVTDLLGREAKGTKNEVLFHIYDDGTVEKRIVIE